MKVYTQTVIEMYKGAHRRMPQTIYEIREANQLFLPEDVLQLRMRSVPSPEMNMTFGITSPEVIDSFLRDTKAYRNGLDLLNGRKMMVLFQESKEEKVYGIRLPTNSELVLLAGKQILEATREVLRA